MIHREENDDTVGMARQLWLLWVAPIIGGVIGALACQFIISEDSVQLTLPRKWEIRVEGKDLLADFC